MIPKGAEGIAHLSASLFNHVLPKANDAYTMSDVGMIGMLLDLVRQDYDRAADVLLKDSDAIAGIFREALKVIDDSALQQRLQQSLEVQPDSYRVTDLASFADERMRLLIELHAAVETAQDNKVDWAASLNDTIWRFLEAHVARHKY